LNQFLESSHLYECAGGDCNNLVLRAPEALTGLLVLDAEMAPPPLATMTAALDAESSLYLAHVHDKGHFVYV